MTADDRKFARRVVIVIALGSVFALLCYTAVLLLLGFAGILGAVITAAAADWLCRRTKLSRRICYLLVLLGGIALVGVALWLLVPRVAVQLGELSQALPNAIENTRKYLNRIGWGRAITSQFPGIDVGAIAAKLTSIGRILLNAAVVVTVMVVLTAYLGENPAYYQRGVLAFFPAAWRPTAGGLFQEIGETLQWWLIGQSVPMVTLGLVTMAGLLILHIPSPLH
ncbi:MAG: AI-2E family transporter [Acidobacteriota bacterium]|nr:AI-2E family transporter [Acidobacteriota bacterium]